MICWPGNSLRGPCATRCACSIWGVAGFFESTGSHQVSAVVIDDLTTMAMDVRTSMAAEARARRLPGWATASDRQSGPRMRIVSNEILAGIELTCGGPLGARASARGSPGTLGP